MAHSPQKTVPSPDPFAHSKTLFLPAPGREGVLIERTASGIRSRKKTFADAHAALTWCQQHSAGLVFYFGAVPMLN